MLVWNVREKSPQLPYGHVLNQELAARPKQMKAQHTEIAATKVRNFHTPPVRYVKKWAGSNEPKQKHTHQHQVGNSRNENANFSHDEWLIFPHEKMIKYLIL
jgi:hypothetical protein